MTSDKKPSQLLNLSLWAAQLILFIGFIWAAYMKLSHPGDKLAEMWPWTAGQGMLVKVTGILDLLAGFGLVLPALLHIQPNITIYTTYGIILLMITASIFHITRGEASQIGINIFFLILSIFIVWGRTKKAPIAPK
ncbi:DoxX family protein [Chryseosolibacter indicus]|uniref:DoxX family protein n=1 Tax=Chryseosolibacter indicus TaxID=2782351 RepID=A0ABS5VS40_9BACT|nr:DoxX family protein [Chryseosolibacter indicus]MBT1704237.1 DoxX family protein [Chryseosolibacter indicus]